MILRILIAWCLSIGVQGQDSVVILLRHAEKAHHRNNSGLSPQGLRRAANLPTDLASFRPVALFASDLPRSRQTLEPLSKVLGLPIEIYARGSEWALGQSLQVRYLGKTVVVCGHSNTLGTLVKSIGYPGPFPEVSGFDRFWVVRVRESSELPILEERLQSAVPLPAPVSNL